MNTTLEFTIIVPTYKEAHNLPLLTKRIDTVGLKNFEVLLMDDNSNDGSEKIVTELQQDYPWLRMIVNKGKRDLSGAIIAGIKQAQAPIVITLDADLSHPPEKIPEMLERLRNDNVEMVIGSRYIKGGSVDSDWPLRRILISRLSALLARPLTKVKDPLSGFVAMKKEICFRGEPLIPIGWKIGLEIMVKSPCTAIAEVPIHFSERIKGMSKLTIKQGFNYLHHLIHLYAYRFLYLNL